MSAIAGIVRFDGRPVDRRDLERMMNTLRAHGPDRSGLHVAPTAGLGHVLMRMTAEDMFDRQPIQGGSGAVMVGDLRIDNRDDLIAALGIDPDQGKVLSDAAVAFAAWERWGNDAWARLRGPFAIAIWQPRTRVLTLARDPVGLRALSYHADKDFFAFATMPKGLFALPDVPRVLNQEKLADFLVLNLRDTATSFYQGVFRLPAAHVGTLEAAGRFTKQQFWSAANIEPIRLKSDEAYAEAMRERLDRAVRRQLRTSHEVGCMLSGGLDSSSVAILAARALAARGKRLPAYTQVPRDGFPVPPGCFDERPYVEAICAKAGTIDLCYVISRDCEDIESLERMFHAMEEPVRNVSNLGWYLEIMRLAQQRGQRVLLVGDAGNATISWDGWDQISDHVLRGRLVTALRQLRQYYRSSARSRWGTVRACVLEPLGMDLQTLIDRLRGKEKDWRSYSAIKPSFAEAMAVEARARRDNHDFLFRPESGTLRQRVRMITETEFRGQWEASILALYGMDLRDPTADLDVVSFCLGIPDEQYLAEGIDRSLVRRAMWGLVPEAVLTNRRRGAQAADWFEKLHAKRPALFGDLAQLRESPLAAETLDLDRLEHMLGDLPDLAVNANSPRMIYEYQSALLRGVALGRFAEWFGQRNTKRS